MSPAVMTPADKRAHPGAVSCGVRRCHDRQQCRTDRTDQRRRQQHERQCHARKCAERRKRLLCLQSCHHQPPRQDDRACRREQIGRERGQRQRHGDRRELPCQHGVDFTARSVQLSPFPAEQKAEQQYAEYLAHRHSGEYQLRHRAAVAAADRVQQHAYRRYAHELFSCFADRGVLHAFQTDEQRFEDIFNAGQHETEQHERKRLRRARIAENAVCNPVAAQQQHRRAHKRKREEHRKRKPKDRAGFVLLPRRLARRRQPRTRHRHARKAAGVQYQIHRIGKPVHAQSFRTCKPAEHHAINKAERLQGDVAAREHPGRIQHCLFPKPHLPVPPLSGQHMSERRSVKPEKRPPQEI